VRHYRKREIKRSRHLLQDVREQQVGGRDGIL
jgi:hypothetical protein